MTTDDHADEEAQFSDEFLIEESPGIRTDNNGDADEAQQYTDVVAAAEALGRKERPGEYRGGDRGETEDDRSDSGSDELLGHESDTRSADR